MLEQLAEGVRKGWQVEELQRMIYGRRPERFIPEDAGRTDATQLSLGDDFAATVPPEVSTIAVGESATTTSIAAPAGRTSRKQKRHLAHRGPRVFLHICPVYKHPENKDTLTNPGPVYLLEKGIAGPGLLAHLHVQKYTYHMPYYRQLQQWERQDGVLLAAATVNDWEAVCVDKYLVLFEYNPGRSQDVPRELQLYVPG